MREGVMLWERKANPLTRPEWSWNSHLHLRLHLHLRCIPEISDSDVNAPSLRDDARGWIKEVDVG